MRARSLAAFTLTLALTAPAIAGRVMLFGHDPDDHGNEAQYTALYDDLFAAVTNGGSGILAIGVDPNTEAEDWIMRIGRSMAIPQTVSLLNDGAISTKGFDNFAIIHIPSADTEVLGGITVAENANLVGRADDLARFVNDGGALFGLTQAQFANAYGWLAPLGAITTDSTDARGRLPSGSDFDDVSATPEGQALGITDDNLDGCCWHNIFLTFPSFLEVLATANEPFDPGWNGQAAGLGGTNVIIAPQGDVAVDIKPTSCPNPLNPRSRGVIPVAILGSASLDVGDIDLDTVRLYGVAPIRHAMEDVATPFEPVIGKTDFLDCTTEGADGFLDLTLKFSTQEVIAAIEADLGRPVEDGEVLVIPLNGNKLESLGGDEIQGEDVMIVRANGRRK